MSYFQSLVDLISICIWFVKIILLTFLVVFFTHYLLTNGLQIFRGISGFLWKRRTDAEEKAEQVEWLRRKQFLYDLEAEHGYRWDGLDWKGPQPHGTEPDTEPDVELGLNSATMV